MDVKRYRADWRHVVETKHDDAQYVSCSDFDRVTAERDQLHVRLTEAEQKADDLLTQLNLSTQRVRDLTEGNGALRVRIANLERGLAGMLAEFDDGVNGGRADRVPALDLARTLVKPAQYGVAECSQTLWLAGKSAPKTCALCGLGPCAEDAAEVRP